MSPTLPALDDTLGAMEIGIVLGTFLFGLLTLQTFNYFRTYTQDTLMLKTLVGVVWGLELAHSISGWHSVYEITVTFSGQQAYILDPPHSIVLMVLFSGVLTMVVETFFAFRVRNLSGRWLITVICSILNVLALIFSIILVVIFWRGNGFPILREKQNLWIVATASCVVPATNILVAISLCYYLWKIHQDQAEFVKTRTMVVTLIVWTAETTIMTSVMSIMQVILFVARDDLVWGTFFLLHAKLLSNCMLASLNGRQRFHSQTEVIIADSTATNNHSVSVIRMNRMGDTSDNRVKETPVGGSSGESSF
ncbi:hypothetical protein DFH08DRAFT_932339 [Mycena albidolilacea]|uniref:DUF6534 domain-containing protein n=1 Tax=Mycena albidolilacea TaxID=1033008 RepID=A0AAD7AGA4_9AGAR|nr:hypothetical protein DFH08DRAFT_932339 [Mycena albidolilacea]